MVPSLTPRTTTWLVAFIFIMALRCSVERGETRYDPTWELATNKLFSSCHLRSLHLESQRMPT